MSPINPVFAVYLCTSIILCMVAFWTIVDNPSEDTTSVRMIFAMAVFWPLAIVYFLLSGGIMLMVGAARDFKEKLNE